MRKNFSRLPLVVLTVSVSGLTGCGKVKGVVGKLAELKAKVAATSDAAAVPGTYSRDQVSEVNKASYDGFIARKDALVIVDFHADWCPPCKKLGPVLVKATEAHPGVVYLGKVNVDQESELAGPLGVSSIPDVRIFKNGVQVDRFVGFPGEAQVLAKIAELSAGIQPAQATATVDAPATAAEPAIKPFEKGWLPPGISRQGQPRSVEAGPSAQR
jgi:thioredoxin 1